MSELKDRREGDRLMKLEKHAQTIIVTLIGIAIIWLVSTTNNNKQEQLRQGDAIVTLTASVNLIASKVDTLYRTTDAARDFALRDALIADNRARTIELEKQMREVVTDVAKMKK